MEVMPKKKKAPPVRGSGELIERKSIRLSEDLAREIEELASKTHRTVPQVVRLLLSIGIKHREDLHRWDD